MENTYGIGVKNRYELFYNDEEDPLEILKQQEEERERRKAEKLQKDKTKIGKSGNKETKVVPTKKNLKETIQNTSNKVQENTDVPPKPRMMKPFTERTGKQSGPRDEPRDMEERKNRRNREERPERLSSSFDARDRSDTEIRRGRGGGRGGRGRGRSRGGGFGNFENRGKREFDRQSGNDRSNVKFVDKREGGGAHNWGTSKDDMEIQMNPPSDENPETGERSGDELPTENTETKENEPTTTEENAEPVEEGPKEMTLDEWKREQESKRSVPKFNLRKPGEGEDTTQWNKLYMLKKKAKEEEDDEDEEDEEEDDIEEEEEFGRRGRQRHLVDIQINFSDSRRGRGRGRGGRGAGGRGGRGGMNRGGAKGSKSEQLAPRVDDWNDFPSLITA